MPRNNVGQVAHVSPTPSVTLREFEVTRRAFEAACWLWRVAGATALQAATLTQSIQQ